MPPTKLFASEEGDRLLRDYAMNVAANPNWMKCLQPFYGCRVGLPRSKYACVPGKYAHLLTLLSLGEYGPCQAKLNKI